MSDPVVAFIYHKITGRGVFRNLSQGGGAQHLLGPKTPLEISDFTERPPPESDTSLITGNLRIHSTQFS